MKHFWLTFLLLAETGVSASTRKDFDDSHTHIVNKTNKGYVLHGDVRDDTLYSLINRTTMSTTDFLGQGYQNYLFSKVAVFSGSLHTSVGGLKRGYTFEFSPNSHIDEDTDVIAIYKKIPIDEDGIYVFTWTFFYDPNSEVCTDLVVHANANTRFKIARSYGLTKNSQVHSTTGTTILALKKGLQISLEVSDIDGCGPKGAILSDRFRQSSFHAYKIYEF